MKTSQEAKQFWNERYSGNHFVYGENPNIFFKQEISRLTPGKLLMPAEGEGRNAVYAAYKGWSVDAFDLSEKAKKRAMELAKRHHVSINYVVSSYQDFEIKPASYNAIGLIYAHIHNSLRRQIHRKLIEGMKSGGTLILEGFSKDQLGNNSGGPKDIDMLYSKEELIKDFQSLDLIKAESIKTVLSEGNHHTGKANIVRVVGKKP